MSNKQYKTFFLPAAESDLACEQLNAFLQRQQVTHVDRCFVKEPTVGWAVCVVYQSGGRSEQHYSKPKTDYRAQLTAPEQLAWDQLREWRANRAREDGKKPYNIFSNAQLHYLIAKRVTSAEALAEVPDWGEARSEHYATALLDLLRKVLPASVDK